MNQEELKKKRNNTIAKLQAIKEVTERVMKLDEEETHGLILIEALDEGNGVSAEVGAELMSWTDIGEE